MDSLSLFLLQPIDQIRLQCSQMEPKTLSRLMQSSKKIYHICSDIMAVKKRHSEEQSLKSIFDFNEPGRIFLGNVKFYEQNFFISRQSGKLKFEEIGKFNLMDNYFRNFPGVLKFTSPFRISYLIDRLDEISKINILSELKKQGYKDVYTTIGSGDHAYRYFGNLDDYQWL